ncbi:MAG: hypothetical protein FJ100_17505 [Deltaproteobacteria bacterium]|nr:hypothetical protein [Deltaproteobacteria bacterium]
MIRKGRRAAAAVALACSIAAAPTPGQPRPAGAVTTRETRLAAAVDASAFAVVDFLSGGAVRASGLAVPEPAVGATEPPWLPHWRDTLRSAAQPARAARDLPLHPLGRVAVATATWSEAPSVEPANPATAAWVDLVCPAAALRRAPTVYTHVAILGEDDRGWLTLGLQLACVSKDVRLLAAVRAVVHADTRGVVSAAQAVRWAGDRPLPPPTGPQAQPAWPIGPALLQSRKPAWVLPNGQGWLVQVQHDPTADWIDDGVSVPMATEGVGAPQPSRRALWWFDRGGQLRQVLMAAGDPSRQPPDGDGAGEFETVDPPGLFVLQRLADWTGAHPGTRAGYAAWDLSPHGARSWRVDLPQLPTPGLWHCLGHAQPPSLHCQFAGLGVVSAPRPEVDLVLLADPARRAFVRPRERR